MSHLLVLNAGSSSLKFGLFSAEAAPRMVLRGKVENIGGAPVFDLDGPGGDTLESGPVAAEFGPGHGGALGAALAAIDRQRPGARIAAVGHRVVHGGPDHAAPVILDDGVIEGLARLAPFAPLHQPHNLAGVAAAREAFPEAVQVACFDTAFHRSHPFVNDVFALPREFYDKGVRRYGFHGLSYDYIAGELGRIAPTLRAGRVVVAHLGNGASMCAMRGGRSVASTMGFSALDGLPMGTRVGQLDPGVMLYLMQQEGLSVEEITDLLYRRSGLLGLSGVSNDMRTLLADESREAREAIDYFVFRIRRELGALAAALEGLDGVVFTGGIGENAAPIRELVCQGMDWIGIGLDRHANATGAPVISDPMSRVHVMVIPTNEELVIARATAALAGA